MVTCFLLSFLSLIAKIESASCVNVSSQLVKNEARNIEESDYRKVCAYVKFMKNSKDISMTVWAFVPMKCNLTLGLCGTILTYSLLFDNLLKF